MTFIVGVKYPEGIVMASDLLGRKGNKRMEHKKIYHNDRMAIGIGGRLYILADADFFTHMVVNSVLGSQEKAEDLEYLLVRFNKTMQARDLRGEQSSCLACSLVAAYDDGAFNLWYHDGQRPLLETHDQFVMAPPEDFFSPDFPGINEYVKAFNVAVEAVKQFNYYSPESCSGLHAVHLTRDGVKEVAYEKPVL